MPAKTPIYLKTPTDRKGRKLKLRDVLSGDMISPPLGDVRHSAHVGLQGLGDMFGDVAFLRGNMDMLPPPNVLQGPKPLWTTTSLPLLLAQEEAPPKPPRLHLDTPPQYAPTPCTHLDTSLQHGPVLCTHLDTPPQHGPVICTHMDTPNLHWPAPCTHLDTPPLHGPAPCTHLDTPALHGRAPCTHLDTSPLHGPAPCTHLDTSPLHETSSWTHSQNISLSPTIRRLVPLSNSSSEDSLLDTCGPLQVPRGLSLDSDAGLSNEDLCSAGSPLPPPNSTTLPRSESIMAALDLDLGPSIMDDVLRIMDRYRGPSLAPDP